MNFSFGFGAKATRLALIAAGAALSIAALADNYQLTVSAENQSTTTTIYFTGSSEGVHISSFNGSLKDTSTNVTQSLGEFYCVDTADTINVPDAPYTVTVGTATGSLAVATSLITLFSPGYPGPVFNGSTTALNTLNTELGFHASSAQLDAGLQLALWETVNGVTHSSDSTLNSIATDMLSINNGATSTRGILLGEVSHDGQSMLYVPGIGGPTPAPEPFTMALGAAGIGMFLARRKRAAK